ncbi:MAG: RNA polymerase sigma factor [Planctomycetes bacterium]|nr:RNA polymerase sigma factor [Planctomycetota bacterium]
MSSPDAALPADEFRAYERSTEEAPAAISRGASGARDSATTVPSDRALLDRARAGDRGAFGVLVERHHQSLGAILRPRCGPDVPLDDLVQEVFARTLAHVGGFRSDASFLTWATSIGLHLASDWRRTGERRRRLAPTVDVAVAEPPCRHADLARAELESRDDLARARRALDALPDEMRIAVTLRVVEDETYETIAARMNAPLPRVRQWVCRGLKRLRGALEVGHDGA